MASSRHDSSHLHRQTILKCRKRLRSMIHRIKWGTISEDNYNVKYFHCMKLQDLSPQLCKSQWWNVNHLMSRGCQRCRLILVQIVVRCRHRSVTLRYLAGTDVAKFQHGIPCVRWHSQAGKYLAKKINVIRKENTEFRAAPHYTWITIRYLKPGVAYSMETIGIHFHNE